MELTNFFDHGSICAFNVEHLRKGRYQTKWKNIRRDEMKKEKTKSDKKKAQYRKPVLTKHKKLQDITAIMTNGT